MHLTEVGPAGKYCPLCGGPGTPFNHKDGHSLQQCGCYGPILLSWPWSSVPEYEQWYVDTGLLYHAGYQEAQGRRPMWERDSEYLMAASVRLRILAGLYPQVRKIMDVGTGTGAFVGLLQAHGYDAVGYEPSPMMAEAARAECRNIITGGWEDIPFLEPLPDVITLHDVLEHLPYPVACLHRLRGLMAPQSILCVEMPEWDCPQSRRDGMNFRHIKPLEHLALYSEAAAVELFRRTDLKVVALVRPQEGTLGKISYYLKVG
jgi:SAM-dependent methyltransferase